MSRTKGASSCVFICLSDLNKVFKADAMIPVHRNFLRMVGLNGAAFSIAKILKTEEETEPQITITENL